VSKEYNQNPPAVLTAETPRLLDLFCGRGGWSKSFAARGWYCVGVDIEPLGYPYEFVQCSVLELPEDFLNSFDAITSSPPCEDFARAWLPWLRGDQKPEQWAIDLLEWSVKLCAGKQNRITECSNFAAKHVPGSLRFDSYALWGDVPLLMPHIPRRKAAKSGMRPDLRAEIPPALADWIADNYTRALAL
jgi:SAM-dependent methyltransferase